MRYLVQLLIPALILIGVIYLVMRTRQGRADSGEAGTTQGQGDGDGEKGTFILILIIGALVAVGVVFALFGDTGA